MIFVGFVLVICLVCGMGYLVVVFRFGWYGFFSEICIL